jgi:hypothetical protein
MAKACHQLNEETLRIPVLAHIHVPKCAGTSFRLLLDDLFPAGHLQLYFEPGSKRTLSTTFVYSDAQIEGYLESNSVKAFSSHHVRRFPNALAGRPLYYVTFLRDPVQQFVSYLNFTRQVFRDITDPVLLSHLPPNMPELSLRESARWLVQQNTDKFLNFRENYTTNFFAHYEVLSRYGFEYTDWRYRGIRQQVARNVLRKFFFVGIAEQMDESLYLLRQKLASKGIQTDDLPMRRDNASENRNEDLSWLDNEDEIGCKVLGSLREDQRLYYWASRRFQLQLAKERPKIPLRWWRRPLD